MPALTLEVPAGWYGNGNSDGFAIGTAFDLADERFDGPSIYVDVIDMPLDQATSKFEQIAELSVLSGPVQGSVDGHAATTFTARPRGDEPVVLEEALGIGVDIVPDAVQQVFVDLGSKTMLIRTETLDESGVAALEETLASLRFAS